MVNSNSGIGIDYLRKNGFGIDKFGIGIRIDKFDVEFELTKWN